MGKFSKRRGCCCFPLRRSIAVIAWSKLCLDISVMVLLILNVNKIFGLYRWGIYDVKQSESLLFEIEQNCPNLNDTTEVVNVSQVSCIPIPTCWIFITPFFKIIIDVVNDAVLLLGYHKRNVDLLRISYAYGFFMGVCYVTGFCYELILETTNEAQLIRAYYLSMMPYVGMIRDVQGPAGVALAWVLWITYVVFLSFYLPYLLKTAIHELKSSRDFVSINPGQDAAHAQHGILSSPLKLGIFKMLVIKKVAVIIFIAFSTYFAIAMWELRVTFGYMITAFVITIPLLMVDIVFNVILYCGNKRADKRLLQLYHKYNVIVRLLNLVAAMAIKHFELVFSILQTKEKWLMLAYNFHIYLVLWMVYIVVHFYVERVTKCAIAKLEDNFNMFLPSVTRTTEVRYSFSEESNCEE